MTEKQQKIAALTYRPSVVLGSARILYSLLFLFGLFSFYELRSTGAVFLLLFWGLFVVVWPLGLPELLSSLRRNDAQPKSIGTLLTTDAPNIVRSHLPPSWPIGAHLGGKIYQQADGKQTLVIPPRLRFRMRDCLVGGCVSTPTDVEPI